MRSVTLRQVAQNCGVSIATVSAVVNGAAWVPPETRSRVQHAVDALGYRPNQLARGLKTQVGYAIGIIVSDLTNPFFTEIIRSLSHALRDSGRALLLCDADHRFDLGDAGLRTLLDGHITGLVVAGDSVPEESLRAFRRRHARIPVIAIERDYEIDGVSCLLVDSEHGAYTVVRHLVDQGHQRIAMITGPTEGPGSITYGRAQRYAGYCRALHDAGLAVDPKLVVPGNFRYTGGREAMERLLASGARPDAVFASNDLMAIGAMDAARSAGLRVPADLALAGNDDIPIAGLITPALTTMAMPKRELGAAAAGLLSAQIPLAGEHHAERRTFSAQLVIRSSSLAVGIPA